MLIEVVPPLFSVTAFGAPPPPTGTDTQLREVGLALTNAFPPELLGAYPESATVCGLGLALSLKFSVAVCVPLTVGAKMMPAVQLADGARLVPQVFE